MKTVITLLILSFSVVLHAQTLSMSEFRKAQRQYVLADFKALYKQRHISSHKAKLRQKHERVKKISHSGILMNQYQQETEQKSHTKAQNAQSHQPSMPQNASMQTQANYEIPGIQQHKNQHGNTPTPNNTQPSEPQFNPNNTQPIEPQFHPTDPHIPNNTSTQNPNISTPISSVDTPVQHTNPVSNPISNTTTPQPPVQTPVQNPVPDTSTPTSIGERPQPNNPTDTSEVASPVTEDTLSVTTPNTVAEPPATNGFERPHIRSLSANPWGRR